MKKLLLIAIAIIVVFSMVACGEKKQEEPETNVTESSTTEIENTNEESVEEPAEEPAEEAVEEQIGVGNTDAGMVYLALERYIKEGFGNSVEEVLPTRIRIFTKEEISQDEAIQSHNVGETDIVFDVTYDLRIAEGVTDMNQFTAGTGEIDGQYIRNKSNVGIARDQGENGYTIDAFGTGF